MRGDERVEEAPLERWPVPVPAWQLREMREELESLRRQKATRDQKVEKATNAVIERFRTFTRCYDAWMHSPDEEVENRASQMLIARARLEDNKDMG